MANAQDKSAQLARIEAIEAGSADAAALTAAWRDAPKFQLNLRTRLRRAVALSPSVSPMLAAELLPKFPRELFENPALPLLLLESPDLLRRAPARFWTAVFAAPELSAAMMPALIAACPPARLGYIARRPEFELADAQALLERLRVTVIGLAGDDLRLTDEHALLLCQQWHEAMFDLPEALVAALRAKSHDPSARTILMGARQLSVDEALALAEQPNALSYPEALALSSREDLSPEVIAALARAHGSAVRTRVAANPATPVEVLVSLVKDRDPLVYAAALLSPRLPRAAYERLLKRGTAQRRAVIASRADLSFDDYALLAAAGEAEVRAAVAQNPHAPPELLARLAADLRDEVLEALAGNPAVARELIAAQGDEAPAAPEKRGRAAKPTMIERARAMLVGDSSGGSRWEPVLAWVEQGGEAPPRVTMSPQDRKKVVRGALGLLGEDPAGYDPAATRLLRALSESLGYLPELNSKLHRRALYGSNDALAALAEAWMGRLLAAGYPEADALALLCFNQAAQRLARDQGSVQRQLSWAALSAREGRALELLAQMSNGRCREYFIQVLVGMTATVTRDPSERVERFVTLFLLGEVRAAVTPDLIRRVAIAGGEPFVKALEARDPGCAKEFLRSVDLRYSWQIPESLLARAREAQGD